MKLRNLFLASLAVCTMASCSKDDDGISCLLYTSDAADD